jgi:hypothetical protein
VIDTPLLTLDDGSGRGVVRISDFAPTFDPPLHLGEVVNVTGTVAARDVGGWEIVASAEGVLRASRLTVVGSSPSPRADTGHPSPSPGALLADSAPVMGAGAGDLVRPLLVLVVVAGVIALGTLGAVLAMASHRRRSGSRSAGSRADAGGSTHERA